MSSATTGAASASPIQNRRFMSMSSWFGAAPRLTRTGSSARTGSAEARPASIKSEVGVDEKPSHPVADEEANHCPSHGQYDPNFGRVVVVLAKPFFRWLGRMIFGGDDKDAGQGGEDDQAAVSAERIVAARNGNC